MSDKREIHYLPQLPSLAHDDGLEDAASGLLSQGFVADCAAASAQGTGRRRNEDAYVCALPVLAVADGVGGERAGHLASWLAIGALSGSVSDEPAGRLRSAFEEANGVIRTLAASEPHAGAATTLTALCFVPGGAWVAHLGDSRAYRARGGALEQLTTDHSPVAELRRRGTISASRARRHPMRSIITRALGVEEQAQPDLLRVELIPGDSVLLCSDGLSKTVGDPEIADALATRMPLAAAVQRLIATAQERDDDDVTVAAARMAAA